MPSRIISVVAGRRNTNAIFAYCEVKILLVGETYS